MITSITDTVRRKENKRTVNRIMKPKLSLRALYLLFLPLILVPDFFLYGSGPDSLCVHFTSQERSENIQLKSDYILSGKVPVTFCKLNPHYNYGLLIYGDAMESWQGKLKFDSGGNPRVCGIRMAKTWRNLIIPGWGSVYEKQTTRGWIEGLSFVSSLYFFLSEDNEYRDLKDDYNSIAEEYKNSDSVDERRKLSEIAERVAREANAQNDHRKNLLWLTTALYAYQLFDTWLLSSPPQTDIDAGGNVVRFSSQRLSTWKAAMLSFIKPGSGQYYQGKVTRGALCTILSTAAGIVALEYYHRYNVESEHYQLLNEQFNDSGSIQEKSILIDRASKQWEVVEEKRRNRNISYCVLAGIWCYSIVDTFFPPYKRENISDSRFSYRLNHEGIAFRVSF
jgi:hypothetical protein